MPKTQIDYSNSYIYKLCCNDVNIKDIYVGSTTNFEQRKSLHKRTCDIEDNQTRVYKFIIENGGWSNWSMIPIEKISCQDKKELLIRERYWLETLQATLNCNNPITSKEEKEQQKQEWYEVNKEIILNKSKENYQEIKEQKIEYQKKYAEENKEKISEYQKEYAVKNKEKIAQQKKEYREKHKEVLKEMVSNWKIKNKDAIKEKKSEIITCECGSQHSFGNKHRHLQSKTHIDYQNKLCGNIFDIKIEDQISEEEKATMIKLKQKEYREKHSEKLKQQKKKYNDSHKLENSEKKKKYYQEHKNEIIEQTKTYCQLNKDKIQEYKDIWYQKNKEKILEKQKQLFTCECGSEVRASSKSSHYKSVKHQQFCQPTQI